MTRMPFDCRCDCGTGIRGRSVGWCEAGGEGTVRGEDFQGLESEGEGEDAVGQC